MKKQLSYYAIMMLAIAMALTSCGNEQAETEKEVPLRVTYTIDYSKDLLNLCDLVVTYKGDDGVDVVDTITADPNDSAGMKSWTKVIQTHKVPVKIGFDYTLVQKTDTLITESELIALIAKGTIIAEKMGLQNRLIHVSEHSISSNRNFYKDFSLMTEYVINTRHNLKTIIDIYNDRQAYKRGNISDNTTCFIVKPASHGDVLKVKKACWNDDK